MAHMFYPYSVEGNLAPFFGVPIHLQALTKKVEGWLSLQWSIGNTSTSESIRGIKKAKQ